MKKKFLLGLSLCCCIVLNAQEYDKQYLNIDFGGGSHRFLYDAGNTIEKEDFVGYTFQFGYSYYFTPSWGIQTGLGLKTFKGAATINLQTAENAIDQLDRLYEFRTTLNDWKEVENVSFLTIPMELKYRIPVSPYLDVIAGLGGELDFTVNKQYSSAGSGSIVTSGYYSEWNTELTDLPEYGFSTYTDIPDGDMSLSVLTLDGIADLGALIKLNENSKLYLGSYLSVGLNNIRKTGSASVYESNGTYNGIFASSDISTIRPFAFGVKLGIYFNVGK